MAEELHIDQHLNREEKYKQLLHQIESLLSHEQDLIANMANLTAIIKEAFDFLWIGFYIVKDKELVLGPFQGPLACTRIAWGKGVCGTAWKDKKTIVVPDVHLFPGHIACSSKSRSEIVVPLFDKTKNVWGVLDLDSEKLADFTSLDGEYLEKIVRFLKP